MHCECYQVFISFSSHGQRSVGDLVCLLLEGFEDHGGCGAPLLALYDRSDGAVLVHGVGHAQGLGLRATYWANKTHHLDTRDQKDKGII